LGQIIPTANENIFKVDIPKSPCRTTIQNIIDERHYLSRKQVGSAVVSSPFVKAEPDLDIICCTVFEKSVRFL
jgi:hypothetical protein